MSRLRQLLPSRWTAGRSASSRSSRSSQSVHRPDAGWRAGLPPVGRALVEAGWAALVPAVLLVLVVVVAWLAGAADSGSGWAAVTLGFDLWLFAQGVPLRVAGEPISVIPWLVASLPFASLTWAARRLVADLPEAPDDDGRRAGVRRDVVGAGGAYVGAYAAIALAVAVLMRYGDVSASVLLAPFGPAALAVFAYVWAIRRRFAGAMREISPRLAWHWNIDVPKWVRLSFRPALAGVIALLAAGLLLVLVMIGVNLDRIAVVTSYVDPGGVGGAILALAQAAYLPTMAAWAVGFVAGPGFSLGEGTRVSWGSAEVGPLPLVPVFGALPDPGELPGWTYATVLVPVLVGAGVAGWALRRAGPEVPRDFRSRAVVAACAPAATGVFTAIACGLASGSLGGQRLAHVGVNPFIVGVALVLELLFGAAIALGTSSLTRARIFRVNEAADAPVP